MAPRPLENGAGGPVARSEEPGAPLPVAVSTAEPGGSMKTTFTIEIKDGRGQASTGRVLLPTGNQRAGRPPNCLPNGDECLQLHFCIQLRCWRPELRVSPKGVLGARALSTLSGTALTPPNPPDSCLSPHSELTLGLRAPPTLLSTSSGGKSTITRVNSPGTLARLGSVTHVTSFSHAPPSSQGGCSVKVSPSSPHQSHHPSASHTLLQGVGLVGFLCSSPTAHTEKPRPREGR